MGPRFLSELIPLVAVIALLYFAGRGGWRWWNKQPREISSTGLAGALGIAAVGWLVVGVEWAIRRAMGDSFAMIIVGPLMLLLAFGAGLAGLAAAVLGIAVVVGAATRPPKNQAVVVPGGVVSIVLNLTYIWALVKCLD